MTGFQLLDRVRRDQGAALDALGFGPSQQPRRIAHVEPAWTMTAYQQPRVSAACLLVPAPIKRAYIFDLAPGASIVERCVSAGLATYLLNWQIPGEAEQDNGLVQYGDRWLLKAVDIVASETGQERVFVIGHSLGGTLAAIFSALYPDRVAGLVLLEAPVRFGSDASALDRFTAVTPHIGGAVGSATVPGSFLDVAAGLAAPATFWGSRWADWLLSLAAGPEAVQLHLRVVRWTLDEMPMPRRLFEDVVEALYRDDRFMRATLDIDGRRPAPRDVRAPILSVIDPRSSIVPPASVVPFQAAASSADTRTLAYRGDTGVTLQHVGVLVGRSAHRKLWPAILDWIVAQARRPWQDDVDVRRR